MLSIEQHGQACVRDTSAYQLAWTAKRSSENVTSHENSHQSGTPTLDRHTDHCSYGEKEKQDHLPILEHSLDSKLSILGLHKFCPVTCTQENREKPSIPSQLKSTPLQQLTECLILLLCRELTLHPQCSLDMLIKKRVIVLTIIQGLATSFNNPQTGESTILYHPTPWTPNPSPNSSRTSSSSPQPVPCHAS